MELEPLTPEAMLQMLYSEAALEGYEVFAYLLEEARHNYEKVARPVGSKVEALGSIAMLMTMSRKIYEDLQLAVEQAREAGAGWSSIARAAGITPQAARRRWDPVARKKHSDYRRAKNNPS